MAIKPRHFLGLVLLLGPLLAYIGGAPVPRYRAERLFFGAVLPVFQRVFHVTGQDRERDPVLRFQFESQDALRLLRDENALDAVIAGAVTDREVGIRLMHWVRDQFPHEVPSRVPPAQSFDGAGLLRQYREGGAQGGFLCGTAAQLLVQAVSSVGGIARRVELRASEDNAHAVVEMWSATDGKWILLDPDYDVYYTVDGVPQNALELNRLWVSGASDRLNIQSRESVHNIYRGQDLLRYYRAISYPLRNDWLSRPLSWWHPDGNHVQNSLVLDVPGMVIDEDFTVVSRDAAGFYRAPYP